MNLLSQCFFFVHLRSYCLFFFHTPSLLQSTAMMNNQWDNPVDMNSLINKTHDQRSESKRAGNRTKQTRLMLIGCLIPTLMLFNTGHEES